MKLILIVVIIQFCVTISYAFDRLPRPRFGLLRPDKMRDIELTEAELLRCSRSLNPFDWLQIPYLNKKLSIDDRKRQEERLEEDRKRLEEDRKRQEEDRKRQEERKLAGLIYEYSDGDRIFMNISRDILSDWNKNDKFLFDLSGNTCINYEDVVPGESYFVVSKKLQSNFESFAAIEADIQTIDCVECIRNGSLYFPPFNEDGTIVIYEYNIIFKKDTVAPGNKFKSPVRPDAVLIHGSKWLILEAKHAFSTALLKDFQAKCDFIRSNADQPWVRKEHPVPIEFTFVACSVSSYSNVESDTPEIVKVVRDGLKYKKVSNN